MGKDYFIFDLSKNHEVKSFRGVADLMIMNGSIVRLGKEKVTRTSKQNAAYWLYITNICELLNDSGKYHEYKSFTGKPLQCIWDSELFHRQQVKPIIKDLFDKKSTKELTTENINKIIDIFTYCLAEVGLSCNFPTQFEQYLEHIEKHGQNV